MIHRRSVVCLLAVVIMMITSAQAQDTLETKLKSAPNPSAITSVCIDDFAWLVGRWRGEALGGIVEDYWIPPADGTMAGMFRLVKGESVEFYEIMTLGKQKGVFMLRLKHFNADLTGWEERDRTIDFPLLDIGENIWFFEGLTIERINDEEMIIYVRLGKNGAERIVPFRYLRRR